MNNSLFGVNVRTLGISRDQVMPVIRQLAPAFTLVHDDPELAALVQAAGLRVVYRQSGDESFDLAPAEFVRVRAANVPAPAVLHTHNERGLTPALAQREIECMKAADAIERKLCIINAATHQSAADWQTMRPAIEYAVAHGHICGVHVYLDGKLDQYAWEFLPLMREYGGTWVLTEFAPIADINDPFTGWRGFMSADAVGAWIRGITPTLKRLNLPACWFSLDHWQPNDYGRSKGFGMYGIAEIIDQMVSANSTAQWSERMAYQPGTYKLDKMPNQWLNIRSSKQALSDMSNKTGELRLGDVVTVVADTGDGWLQLDRGFVSLLAGAVEFAPYTPPIPDGVKSEQLTDDELQALIEHYTAIAGIYRALQARRKAA